MLQQQTLLQTFTEPALLVNALPNTICCRLVNSIIDRKVNVQPYFLKLNQEGFKMNGVSRNFEIDSRDFYGESNPCVIDWFSWYRFGVERKINFVKAYPQGKPNFGGNILSK